MTCLVMSIGLNRSHYIHDDEDAAQKDAKYLNASFGDKYSYVAEEWRSIKEAKEAGYVEAK
jgi:hypothetical protein